LSLARRVEVAAGSDRLVHRLSAPCPQCEVRGLVELSLTRDDGADHVSCRICGSSWPEDDYRRLTLVLASEAAS
jgi:Zn ribbon nucleic-acid-binding protein